MKQSEIPITLWNGKFLDGILTIITNELPEEDESDLTYRSVNCVLKPQSGDLHYIACTKINNTHDSLTELLNTITYEYIDLVVLFKDRELENGSIRLH